MTTPMTALARARGFLTNRQPLARGVGGDESTGDATMALRDLAAGMRSLTPRQRAEARSLLARPTDGSADPEVGYRVAAEAACSSNVCFHWVTTTDDAPPLEDEDGDQIPDWVEVTGGVFEQVWSFVVNDFGYRRPLSDDSSSNYGVDGRLDIYLADLGSQGTYGYCTTDDPALSYTRSAFCVVDNDFSEDQFQAPPLDSLRVTAAHELFHAVQFAYDFLEDLWFMEGTATWIEDEVYDGINNNRQYLKASPLAHPTMPIDAPIDGMEYGNWVFWAFLSEYFGSQDGPDPAIVRRIWEMADAKEGSPDLYGLLAVQRAVAGRGSTFSRVFADFGAVNRLARWWYSEGESYPQNALARRHVLRLGALGTAWNRRSIDHLTNHHVAFKPGRGLHARNWTLRLGLDLPNSARGAAATIAIHLRGGGLRWRDIALNRSGDALVDLPFSNANVSYVALTLTNASTRYECYQGTPLACEGLPLDDGLAHWYKARAYRR